MKLVIPFQWLFKKKIKSIAFLDGDQCIKDILNAYTRYLEDTETHLVRACKPIDIPKKFKTLQMKKINMVFLDGYKAGKEVTDKYIGASIQKALSNGYRHITVVSSDYDFVDIFKLAMILNPNLVDEVTFRIIVPKPMGNFMASVNQVTNIEVVRMK